MSASGAAIVRESVGPTFRSGDCSSARLFVALAFAHALTLLLLPTLSVVAIGMWWNANTISHNFIHRPFFRARWMNAVFSAFLTLLIGIPQRLWRDRHLAHHADRRFELSYSHQLVGETALLAACWTLMIVVDPLFASTLYFPGWCTGLALCAIQGHYEHAGGTRSHYGWLYNALCFNDGYHVEHHRDPGSSWKTLPARVRRETPQSFWPPLLRWIDGLWSPRTLLIPTFLDALERVVLTSPALQTFVLRRHRAVFRTLLERIPQPGRVAIVGGGLFPRTALILQELLPSASLVVIDANAGHLARARAALHGRVEFDEHEYSAASSPDGFDLVVIPLAFRGDREAVYARPPAPSVLIHDWIWKNSCEGRTVSPILLKRLNLVRR